ncbi:MAG: polyribonucleotide nucleotidyltransferase, partial [Armatimonadetes bacterium]|nr:polyribonucleotide nucleotidyltransferase [Armatimonadota bacterium]
FRREGRPSDEAILTGRRIDRPIRPLLPSGLRHEVQIIATPLSAEHGSSVDVVSMLASSVAMSLSSAPFSGPLGIVQIGRHGGETIVNPSFEEIEEGEMALLVAATREGIVMIELQGKQVPENVVAEGLQLGFEQCQVVIDAIEPFIEQNAKPTGDFELWEPRPEIRAAVEAERDRLVAALDNPIRRERQEATRELVDDLVARLSEQYDDPKPDIEAVVADLTGEHLKYVVLEEGRRVDGRAFEEIRPVSCEVGLLPRVHGSGLFQRGETQVLTITTLGATTDQRLVRTLEEEDYERFMHHYNFPPFSVGETRPLRAPSRRDIGHGALAQSALHPVLPEEDEFPYTIRLVSEVLESNGSTSMAATCGSTLALMDAGVPIKAPVAGISIGLVWDGPERYQLLTDIQGLEDFEGYMDFKVAGTRLGITAIQMDTKTQGLPVELLAKALEQAREARVHILDIMAETLPYPRTELSPYAPRMFSIHVDREKIGLVIGPGGRTVRGIQDEYDVEIDVHDDGTVYVFGTDGTKVERAKKTIEDLTRDVEVGEVFTGKVVSVMPFGAFVEILPGREGLLHISHLAWEHVDKTEDVVKVGDEVEVKVIEVDPEGKIRLSRKELLPKPENYRERRPREGGHRSNRDRGGRRNDRGDRRR